MVAKQETKTKVFKLIRLTITEPVVWDLDAVRDRCGYGKCEFEN